MHFFDYLETKKYKIQYRVMLARYRGKTTCPECRGTRLKKEASYVKINGVSLAGSGFDACFRFESISLPALNLITMNRRLQEEF